jgi:tetratricopeptide (TPR) repeat protein
MLRALLPHRARRAGARSAVSCAVALLVLAPLGAAQEEEVDTVYLSDGNSETGKVLEENWSGLALQPERGAKKVIPWASIQAVDYFDASEDLDNGLATLAAGNAERAHELFLAVMGAEGNRPMTVQQALFYAAFAEQRLGKDEEAVASYTRLLKEFPKGRYLRLAAENLIQLHVSRSNEAAARAALDELTQSAKGEEGVDALLQLLEARLVEGKGDLAAARERYAALESMAGAPAELVQEGKLGRARTLLADGKSAEAEPILRALIAESQSPRVQSGAWNGIGQIQSVEGRAKKDSERILEGLYAYLRTVVQYKPLPGESTEEYERALAGAAACFEMLSELEQNPEKKKVWRERHRERIEQLELEYPGSSFLVKK